MHKNDEFEPEITVLSDEGFGIGKLDGFVQFVKGTLPGDTALCLVMKLKKNYGFACVKMLLKPSSKCVTSRCAVEQRCGGCRLQALSYEAELRFKANKARKDLLRISEVPVERLDAIMEAIVGMKEPSRYRNKAQVPFVAGEDGRLVTGFYVARSHRVIPWLDCDIDARENARTLEVLLALTECFGIAPYDEESGKGLPRRTLIRESCTTKSYMLCLIVNGKELPYWEALFQVLRAANSEDARLETLVLNTNTRRDNVTLGDTVRTFYGRGYIEDSIGDIRFRISPHSLCQVNPVQTEAIYGAALEFAALGGNEAVQDLYRGIGTIFLLLAQQAKKVYGVEIVPAAVRDAKENAKRNDIANAEFFTGAAEEVLPAWQREHSVQYIDVITADPPRKDCDETALRTMVELAPKCIVYVSCNPSTFARDTKYLHANGYKLMRVRPVDNFPRAMHVETVCSMSGVEEKQPQKLEYIAVFG